MLELQINVHIMVISIDKEEDTWSIWGLIIAEHSSLNFFKTILIKMLQSCK